VGTPELRPGRTPRFAEGGFVYSPREAVHAAILHGREIVDGLTNMPA